MLRKFLCVAALAMFAVPAQAGIMFNQAVDLNFAAVDGTLTKIVGVDGMDFGSNALSRSPTGRVAVNTTDNGDGVFGLGDSIKTVGHGLIDQISIRGFGNLSPLDFGQAKNFQLTGLLRDLTGTVSLTGDPFTPVANVQSSGFLDLYLQTFASAAAKDFDVNDAKTSANGTKVATFQLLSGRSTLSSPVSSSSFEFLLIDQLGSGTATLADDFFQLQDGSNPLTSSSLLATQVISVDARQPVPGPSLIGISGIGPDPLNIGTGFVPGNLPSGDFFANIDGSASFGQVPEPASLAIFGMLGAAGVFGRRRKNKKA